MHHRLALLLVPVALLSAAAAASGTTVYGASSLSRAFKEIDPNATFSFLASDTLERQIEAGAPADLFASASPKYAQKLFAAGRCSKPVTFATNVLVLVTPRSNPGRVLSINDLATGPRRRIAVGNAAAPIGAYTRSVLATMHLGVILRRNAVSSEPDVRSIVAKVVLGSADAGFVYLSDWKAASTRLRLIRIPARFQPPIAYQACVVKRSGADTTGANAFMAKLTGPLGRQVLARYGFGLPTAH